MDKKQTFEYLRKASANLAEARALLEEIQGEYSQMDESQMPIEDLDAIVYDWLCLVESVEGDIDDLLGDH